MKSAERMRCWTFGIAALIGVSICLLPSCPPREATDTIVSYPAYQEASIIIPAPSTCAFIEAQTRHGFRTACVTDEEIAIMTTRIHSNRFAQTDTNLRGSCTYLPRTTLCATPDETEEALWFIDQQRINRRSREPQQPPRDVR